MDKHANRCLVSSDAQIAVIDCGADTPRRCHGRPATSQSNCSRVRLSEPAVLARPGEAASLQAPRAQPHPRPVIDQHLEPVGTAVGKHVGVVGLCAQREAAHHQGQQRVDAPAQVARAKRQPDDVDANHWLNSRSSAASSRV